MQCTVHVVWMERIKKKIKFMFSISYKVCLFFLKSEVKQAGLPVIAWLQLASVAMGKKSVCSIILKAVMNVTLCWRLQVVAAPIFPKV